MERGANIQVSSRNKVLKYIMLIVLGPKCEARSFAVIGMNF